MFLCCTYTYTYKAKNYMYFNHNVFYLVNNSLAIPLSARNILASEVVIQLENVNRTFCCNSEKETEKTTQKKKNNAQVKNMSNKSYVYVAKQYFIYMYMVNVLHLIYKIRQILYMLIYMFLFFVIRVVYDRKNIK